GANGTPLVIKSPGDASALAEPLAQLNKQLEPSGVKLSVTPAKETSDGVIAPVLSISMFTPNSAISRAATTTFSAGRTSAAIRTEATTAAVSNSGGDAAPAAEEGQAVAQPASLSAPSAAPGDVAPVAA